VGSYTNSNGRDRAQRLELFLCAIMKLPTILTPSHACFEYPLGISLRAIVGFASEQVIQEVLNISDAGIGSRKVFRGVVVSSFLDSSRVGRKWELICNNDQWC
jgi:hypothetical protein